MLYSKIQLATKLTRSSAASFSRLLRAAFLALVSISAMRAARRACTEVGTRDMSWWSR